MKKKFRVVGVQIMPLGLPGEKQFIQSLVNHDMRHSYSLVEKLVRPVNRDFEERLRYEDSKEKSKKRFSVVAIIKQGTQRAKSGIDGSIKFNADLTSNMSVENEIMALVRVIN